MGVGARLYMYVVVVQKFTFAISSPDEFLYSLGGADVHPNLTHASLGPPDSASQTAPRSVQPFFSHLTLQWVTHPVPRNRPFAWGVWTLSNTWFLGSTRVHIPNSISIGSAILQGSWSCVILRQTDRPRDHATRSIAIGRIYVVLRCGLKICLKVSKTEIQRNIKWNSRRRAGR